MAEEPADPNEDFDNSLAEIISHIGDDDQTPVQRGELRQVLRAAFISERHAVLSRIHGRWRGIAI